MSQQAETAGENIPFLNLERNTTKELNLSEMLLLCST